MSSRYRIGDLTLDTGRRLLRREADTIPLGPLTYRVLLALVEAAPNVVSHDELVRSVWDGRPAAPETISQRIKLLRDALGDDPANPRYIEGVRGHGYRLLPPVAALQDAPGPARNPSSWIARAAMAIAVLAAVAIGTWFIAKPPAAVREGTSIAVLPFEDLSADRDQQHLADGISEEILTLLSRATPLRVIARTSSFSFRDDRKADVTSIGRALRVSHVLEGTVRRAGGRIRVTVRLVDASDGTPLWSQTYDEPVDDILGLQTNVARSVAAELKANLQSTPTRPVNAEAYELYTQGQQKVRQWSYGEAVRYFERALEIDAGFIPTYYGIGVAYIMQVVDVQAPVAENREKLREVLSRGLQLAPKDPGLIALSAQLARYDGDNRLAEERFATALQADPSNTLVRNFYSMFKLDQGDPEEALRLIRRSIDVDPFNPITYVVVWASHLDLWQEKEAMAAAAEYTAHSDPGDTIGHVMTGMTSLLLAGEVSRTIGDIKQAQLRIEPRFGGTPTWLPLFYYLIDDLQTGDVLLQRARETPWNGWWVRHAEVYGALAHGRIDEARRLAIAALPEQKIWGGGDTDMIVLRLAIDGMIADGEPHRAVELLEKMAPAYARYKSRKDIDAADFFPAPIPLKSAYSSHPALYFPDYARALRAAGDEAGANRILDHLEAVLELRRMRGLFIEERHTAELLALRGRTDAALDALEKAERDRTIYHWWHLGVLHNEIFAELRQQPRFRALIERMRNDLRGQRDELPEG